MNNLWKGIAILGIGLGLAGVAFATKDAGNTALLGLFMAMAIAQIANAK